MRSTLLIAALFLSLKVSGQDSKIIDSTLTNARGKFRIGPTLGIGTSFMYDANQTKRKEHIHLGILGNYKINKMFNFQQAICLSTKGYGGGGNGNGYSYDAEKVNLTYLDALFTLKFQPW